VYSFPPSPPDVAPFTLSLPVPIEEGGTVSNRGSVPSDHSTSRNTPWLWPAVSLEVNANMAADAAIDSVDLVSRLIDGAQWLRSAKFDSVMYGINLRKGPGAAPTSRIHHKELQHSAEIDVATLPADKAELAWWFFSETLRTLTLLAQRYELPAPPLRLEAAPANHDDECWPPPPGSAPPPASPYAASDVEADLAALDDNEVLLVIRYIGDHETEQEAAVRRRRQEAALAKILGRARASSVTGNAYTITFHPPPLRLGHGILPRR
jgi:hypothetical protein